MMEQEIYPKTKENIPSVPIFPIDPIIIRDFFNGLPEKDPKKYKGLFLDKLELINGYDPDLYLKMSEKSGLLAHDFPQFCGKNNYMAGGYIAYQILTAQADSKNFELPLIDRDDSVKCKKIEPYRRVQVLSFADFAFVKENQNKDQFTMIKKEKLLNDIALFANEEPDFASRLRIPNNSSMLIGASFVYGEYRKILANSNIVQ